MRVWVITLLTLMAALAGCTDGDDGDAPGDSMDDQDSMVDDTDDTGSASNGTGGSGGAEGDGGDESAENTAPTATLSANVTSGEIPFNVLFEFNGSDPDGDDLSWSLDVDGDGTPEAEGIVLPGNFTYTFDVAGTYNATFNVSDGVDSNEVIVTITASEGTDGGDGGDGGDEESGAQSAAGEWLVGLVSCPHAALGAFEGASAGDLAMGGGVFWGYFEVDASTYGKTWKLLANSDTSALVELDFYDEGGVYMEYHGGELGVEFSGKVPAGAAHAFVFPCGAGPGDFTYTAG